MTELHHMAMKLGIPSLQLAFGNIPGGHFCRHALQAENTCGVT